MSMQKEIISEIENILETEVSEVSDQVQKAVKLVEDVIDKIEDVLLNAMEDLSEIKDADYVAEYLNDLCKEL